MRERLLVSRAALTLFRVTKRIAEIVRLPGERRFQDVGCDCLEREWICEGIEIVMSPEGPVCGVGF